MLDKTNMNTVIYFKCFLQDFKNWHIFIIKKLLHAGWQANHYAIIQTCHMAKYQKYLMSAYMTSVTYITDLLLGVHMSNCGSTEPDKTSEPTH